MHIPNLSELSLLVLTFALPVISCVQFSANTVSSQGTGLCSSEPSNVINTANCSVYLVTFSAALTDNGGQKCQLSNEGIPSGAEAVELSCVAGYSATFYFDGEVEYAYSGFSGSFGTSESSSQDGPYGAVVTYWTANVWGC